MLPETPASAPVPACSAMTRRPWPVRAVSSCPDSLPGNRWSSSPDRRAARACTVPEDRNIPALQRAFILIAGTGRASPEGLLGGAGGSSPTAGLSRVVVHSERHRLTAPGGGQCVRYLLCGLFPAAQVRPPVS